MTADGELAVGDRRIIRLLGRTIVLRVVSLRDDRATCDLEGEHELLDAVGRIGYVVDAALLSACERVEEVAR